VADPGRDVDAAIAYVRQRLSEELPAWLSYHDLEHTEGLVVPAARGLADALGVDGRDLDLLVTAAWFHDLGFTVRYEANEDDSMAMAAELLPTFGYSTEDIDVVLGIISVTRLPQQPTTLLQEIMCDADLFVLGTDRFRERELRLREELAHAGSIYSDVSWERFQQEFVERHRYFTEAARASNDAAKAANLREVKARLAQAIAADEIS
jgi:uncharacterized protein